MTSLRISLDSTVLAEGHLVPGQYVRLSLPGVGESIFAIASAPGEGGYFDFLIKRGSKVADALTALGHGDTVLVSPATGQGFALEAARGGDLLLIATGSGISAIRSVVDTVRRDRQAYGRVWLLFGARTPDELAYADEFDRWRADGIVVWPTVSRSAAEWTGRKGWVAAHLPDDLDPARTWALMAGRKEMIEQMKELLARRGIPREQMLLNF